MLYTNIHTLFHKGPLFEFIYISFLQRGDPYGKKCFLELRKHTLIFCMVVIGTHTNWKMQQKVVGQFFAYIAWAK